MPNAARSRRRARRLGSAGVEEGDHGQDATVVVVGLGQVQLGEDGADVFSTVPSVTHSRRPMPALEGHGQGLFRRDTSLRAPAPTVGSAPAPPG